MKIILIILAVIFIPMIVNLYLFAIILKREGRKNITVEMAFEEMSDMSFLCLFPGVSILGMIIVFSCIILDLLKNVRLL